MKHSFSISFSLPSSSFHFFFSGSPEKSSTVSMAWVPLTTTATVTGTSTKSRSHLCCRQPDSEMTLHVATNYQIYDVLQSSGVLLILFEEALKRKNWLCSHWRLDTEVGND